MSDNYNAWEYEQQRIAWIGERLQEIEQINEVLKNPNLDETAKVELNKSIALICHSMNNPVIYIPFSQTLGEE